MRWPAVGEISPLPGKVVLRPFSGKCKSFPQWEAILGALLRCLEAPDRQKSLYELYIAICGDLFSVSLEKHNRAYDETEQVLAQLGEAEERAIDSFTWFADTMERIQGRPQFKSNVFSSVKLPNYEPNEIKTLSIEVKMAIGGAGGAGIGALAGLAAFGAGAIIAAPAMIGAGLVLCVKGFGLKKKAIENKRQAKEMMKSIDEIVAFYAELRTAADTFRESLNAVYYKYSELLTRIEAILQVKSVWKEFT